MRLPLITAREWRVIAPLLPPTHGPGKPRQDDRRYVSAFYYCEATRASLDSLPPAYGNPRSLRTRRQRWERGGILAKLMQAGAPVIARMHDEYIQRLRAHSEDPRNWGSPIFGTGVIPKLPRAQPRGRYAGRQRVPTG